MRIYSDTATRLLEEFALKMGAVCQIRKIEVQEEGRYFVIAVDDEPLKWPVAIGFTDQQAKDAIRLHTWERFAVKGGPATLQPKRPRRYSKRRRYPW